MSNSFNRREKVRFTMSWQDDGRCTGCRTCELACSFHRTGAFQPERSTIRVERDDIEGRIFLKLATSCDHCLTESSPRCVHFCAPRALTIPLLRERWAMDESTRGEEPKA